MMTRSESRPYRRGRRAASSVVAEADRIIAPRDRTEAISWARTLTGDPRTVFLDTETTGLGGADEVIEIAVVGIAGDVLLDLLIRPRHPIPAVASAVHGILDHHLVDAPSWDAVHPSVTAVLQGRAIVVYNATFDQRLVRQSCHHAALPEPEAEWHCAMRAFAVFHGGAGQRWHKLASAARLLGCTTGGHRALADALACRGVVLAMADERDAF